LKAAFEGKLVPQDPNDEPAEEMLRRLGKKPVIDSIISPLPVGWCWMHLEELCDVASGSTPKGIDSISHEGHISWFRVSDMNSVGNEKFLLSSKVLLTKEEAISLKIKIMPEGTILFPKRGGAIATNKKRILNKPSSYDLNLMGIFPKIVNHRFFWIWFDTIDLSSLSDGSNVPQINHDDIKPLLVPFPPENEQMRIVNDVEWRLSLVNELEQVLTSSLLRSTNIRHSILKLAFEGKLV